MVTRIDLAEKVKRDLRSNEEFIWCGSTVAGAKMWEMEESGEGVIIGSVAAILLGIFSFWAVFFLECSAGDKVMFAVLSVCCLIGVFVMWRLKSAGANFALTDRRALLLTDSGRILKEYNFRHKDLFIDYHVSRRNVGYVVLFTRGVRGRKDVHFRFKGVYDPEELYQLVTTVYDYRQHGGIKIVRTGKPEDKEAPVTAAQPVTEKPLALSGYKKLSDVTGVLRHINDAEDNIAPLSRNYEAEEHIYEHLEPGEKLLWCDMQDNKSSRGTKGGCLFMVAALVIIFELIIRFFGWFGNYPEEVFQMTRMLLIPTYAVMGIMLLAVLFSRSKDIWAVTDRRLIKVRKKHIAYSLLSDVPMNGIQLTERPDTGRGDLRIRAGWKDHRTGKELSTISIWTGVNDARAVADLIDRAAVRYLKKQGFSEVGIGSEKIVRENKNNFR